MRMEAPLAAERTISRDRIEGNTRVTVVIPVKNEREYINRCIDAIMAQNYPIELLEILCVDGMSQDGTRELIESYTAQTDHLRIVDNPSGLTPHALNIAISCSTGDVIVRIDSRSFIRPDYIKACVRLLEESGAWNVGGRQDAISESGLVAGAIATALGSPFAMGGAKFHYSNTRQYVDTVYLGAFPRNVFNTVGLYDEDLVRNQDYEFNIRIRKAGGKILFDPALSVQYIGRGSPWKLLSQFYQYGWWKVQVLRIHPDSIRVRHFIAPVFFSLFLISLVGSLWYTPAFWLSSAMLGVYLCLNMAATLHRSSHRNILTTILLPIIYLLMHLSWTSGFLANLMRLRIMKYSRHSRT